jgi:PKHD-type hydroxylase
VKYTLDFNNLTAANMILAVSDVLSKADITALCNGLAHAPFVPGEETAGWSAQLVKSNLQAAATPESEALRSLVRSRLMEHPVFALATRPKAIVGPLFSRYLPGHVYGAHVDNALIGGVRTDVSFTLFLSDPTSYDGGELVIDTPSGEEAFKLEPGCIVTYPATTLHRVAPVMRGERLAAAGWVRSHLRDAAQRELLFDLETARRRLFEREGKTAEADLLAKCAANLMRMWCGD